MESLGHRRRLKKKALSEDNEESKSDFLIPKKNESDRSKKRVESISVRNKPYGLEDEDSLDEFITDKIEYFQDALPSSSEESAHSTDEENGTRRRKPRKRPRTPSEDSAIDTESSGDDELKDETEANPELPETEETKSEQEKSEEKQEILLGKKALEAKRAKGLLPPKDPKPPAKKERAPKKMKKATPEHSPEKPKKRHKESELKGKYVQFAEFDSPEDRKKAELVTKLLCRWWYALEDWPPARYDYSEKLRSQKLRLVSEESWNNEPVFNSAGLEKVKQVPNYPGLFQSSRGVIHDMRPQETCPCFDNLFKKPKRTLRELLVLALEKQVEELEAQPNFDKGLSARLRREITYEKGKLGN
mmetsp:Transcript_13288/g.24926  ORF Transcript_13288/g.24926 Transcript_13288/m.24926 type:complete len:360 (+) Transcript_13288:1210-2289(+)